MKTNVLPKAHQLPFRAISMAGVTTLTTLVLAGCGSNATSADRVVTLRFGHIYSANVPSEKCGAEPLSKDPALRESGIEVKVYPAASLGSENDLIQQVSSGNLDMTLGTLSILSGTFDLPDLAAFESYYVYDSVDDMYSIHSSPAAQERFAQLTEEANLQVVGKPWLAGVRNIFGDRPIRTPSDLAGMKFRVPETQASLDSAKAMGAEPTTVAWSELYLALQQGLVDGAESVAATTHAESFDEVIDYYSLTQHLITGMPVVVNADAWRDLTSDQQTALQQAVTEASDRIRECVEAADKEVLDAWRESDDVKVVEDADVEAFKKQVRAELSSGYAYSKLYRSLVQAGSGNSSN